MQLQHSLNGPHTHFLGSGFKLCIVLCGSTIKQKGTEPLGLNIVFHYQTGNKIYMKQATYL